MIENRMSTVTENASLELGIQELESLDAPWTWGDAGNVLGNVAQGAAFVGAGATFAQGVVNTYNNWGTQPS
ncbi:hypothetical protein AB0O76_42165 [Streptomyces sp. NPDC086554]|uniref:hypothetical protein n=1 Tax=Streptomyces sp. NPDC086554 TaxID=3154864 RepID=UPI00341FB3E3